MEPGRDWPSKIDSYYTAVRSNAMVLILFADFVLVCLISCSCVYSKIDVFVLAVQLSRLIILCACHGLFIFPLCVAGIVKSVIVELPELLHHHSFMEFNNTAVKTDCRFIQVC